MKTNRNKPGRNDACYCGSGKKYKRCCLPFNTMHMEADNTGHNTMSFKKTGHMQSRIKQNVGDNVTVLQGELDGIKMSAVILEVADFLFEIARTDRQVQSAAAMACMAWNIAVIGVEQAPTILDSYFKKINDRVHEEDTIVIIQKIAKRKDRLYPSINRMILDYELIGTNGCFDLNVFSTVPDEYMDKLTKDQMANLFDNNSTTYDLLEAIKDQ